MLSKLNIKKTLVLGALLLCVACDNSSDFADENIIGLRLSELDSISESQNEKMLNIFDEVTNRIHTFDVERSTLLFSTEVPKSDGGNYVIASDDDKYFISLSQFGFDFHSYTGGGVRSYGNMVPGELVSYAFNKETRHLVVYDDLGSIGLVKMETFEESLVDRAWVGGPLITEENSVQAGDIMDDGNLVLSLAGAGLAIVDIEGSIETKSWVYTEDTVLNATNIKWISSVGASVILINSDDALTLYDVDSQTVLDSIDLTETHLPVEYSKSGVPHVVFKEKFTDSHKLVYAKDGLIKTVDFFNLNDAAGFSQSRLDAESDSWTYIALKKNYLDFTDGSFELSDKNRFAIKRRLSDLLVLENYLVPDDAILKRTKSSVLALYPSELGYARIYNLDSSGGYQELRNFNIPYITKDMDADFDSSWGN